MQWWGQVALFSDTLMNIIWNFIHDKEPVGELRKKRQKNTSLFSVVHDVTISSFKLNSDLVKISEWAF